MDAKLFVKEKYPESFCFHTTLRNNDKSPRNLYLISTNGWKGDNEFTIIGMAYTDENQAWQNAKLSIELTQQSNNEIS